MRSITPGLVLKLVSPVLVIALVIYGMVRLAPAEPTQFYPVLIAVTICATALFGRASGYVCAAVGPLAVSYFALPGADFAVADPIDAAGLVGLIAANIIAVLVVGWLADSLVLFRDQAQTLDRENGELSAIVKEHAHRLRNDLGGLAAVALLRASTAEQAETREALGAIADRITAQARVHARLDTGAGARANVDLKTFIEGLGEDFRFAHLSLRPIGLSIDAISYEMPTGRAVIIGLIVNELLTNAAKYAFPDERPGTISITLGHHPTRKEMLQLIVADDGVGFRSTRSDRPGLGQKLVAAMASQLGGSFTLARLNNATAGQVDFPRRG